MLRFLKWTGVSFAGLVGVIIMVLVSAYLITGRHLSRTYVVSATPIPLVDSEAAIQAGKRLAAVRGCLDCHGTDLSGRLMVDDPALGRLSAANLTTGKGGIGRTYQDIDWERALRHGVNPTGRALILMPSHELYYMTDQEVADVVAYVRSVPPVDKQHSKNSIGPIGRLLYVLGKLPLIPAEMIDHTRRPNLPKAAVTAEYGKTLAVGCTGCHGQNFAGQRVPGSPKTVPPAANLTPDVRSGLGQWSESDFVTLLREGLRPDGSKVHPQMPIEMTRHMTEVEMKAVYAYLKTVQPVSNKL